MINQDYVTKLQCNIDRTYCILTFTRKNPDQDLHKKIRIFYAPRIFSGQNIKKSAQIMRANTVYDFFSQ